MFRINWISVHGVPLQVQRNTREEARYTLEEAEAVAALVSRNGFKVEVKEDEQSGHSIVPDESRPFRSQADES